jgi:hypothetical protein
MPTFVLTQVIFFPFFKAFDPSKYSLVWPEESDSESRPSDYYFQLSLPSTLVFAISLPGRLGIAGKSRVCLQLRDTREGGLGRNWLSHQPRALSAVVNDKCHVSALKKLT